MRSLARSSERASSSTIMLLSPAASPLSTRRVTARSARSAACSISTRRAVDESASSLSAASPPLPSDRLAAASRPRTAASAPEMAPSQSSLRGWSKFSASSRGKSETRKEACSSSSMASSAALTSLVMVGLALRPLDRTAGLERDSVGLPLDALGARRMACRVNAAISPIGNIAGHSRGDIASETELADDGGEQSAFVALDATHQVDFESLAHRARRTPLAQGFGRQPERGLEKFKCCLPPEHVAQLLAEADAGGRSLSHGRSNQLDAAELKKATVTDLMPRGPIQQNNGIAIADQL